MGVFDFTAYNSKVYACLDELWRTNEKTPLSVIYCRYRDPQLLFLPLSPLYIESMQPEIQYVTKMDVIESKALK